MKKKMFITSKLISLIIKKFIPLWDKIGQFRHKKMFMVETEQWFFSGMHLFVLCKSHYHKSRMTIFMAKKSGNWMGWDLDCMEVITGKLPKCSLNKKGNTCRQALSCNRMMLSANEPWRSWRASIFFKVSTYQYVPIRSPCYTKSTAISWKRIRLADLTSTTSNRKMTKQ